MPAERTLRPIEGPLRSTKDPIRSTEGPLGRQRVHSQTGKGPSLINVEGTLRSIGPSQVIELGTCVLMYYVSIIVLCLFGICLINYSMIDDAEVDRGRTAFTLITRAWLIYFTLRSP